MLHAAEAKAQAEAGHRVTLVTPLYRGIREKFDGIRPSGIEFSIALSQAECNVRYYWSTGQRKLTVNEKPIRRLADYLGTLRTVVFCTEDLHLVKGSAKSRRRFLDLLLCVCVRSSD